MSRLPIRLRLTLVFAAVMAVVLAAIGLAVYFRFEAQLDASADRALRSRAGDLAAVVRRSGTLPERAAGDEESSAQLLDERGRVLDTLGAIEPGEPVSRLTVPVGRLSLVVAISRDDDSDALGNLRALLLVGGPLALLLASAAGYGVAAAALRPVEAMRRRAGEIGDGSAGERLPVGPADDEIARLGETLNAMLERLEGALARERAFVADASHELRTPLAILRGELELALRSGRSRAELEAALRSAAEEADRLSRLADDLLLLARLDRGQLPLRPERIEARALLEDVAGRFGAAGRTIVVEAPPELVLHADRLRLEQALGNLVDNALRHGDGAVRLSAAARNGHVELHVSDDGPGPPDGLDAFERFTRGAGARDGGAGLGLAIVRAIAASHGGRATAGPGAEFAIELPLIAASSASPTTEA